MSKKYVNGELVSLSEDEEKAIQEESKKHKEEFAKIKYIRYRSYAYPNIQEHLALLYHDMTAGKGDKTGEWYKAVNKVKTDNPKPE